MTINLMLINLIIFTLLTTSSLIIQTNFKNKNDIFDKLLETKFYHKLIEIIDPDEYHFDHDFDINKKINFPLSLSYKKKPFFKTCLLLPAPKIVINQTWSIKDEIIIINTNNRFLNIITKISLFKKNKYFCLNISNYFTKHIYIPQKFITQILKDINNIINKLIDS